MQIELPKQLHQTSTAYDHNNINEQVNALVAARSSMASVSSSCKTLHMHCMDGWWLHYLHPVLHAAGRSPLHQEHPRLSCSWL